MLRIAYFTEVTFWGGGEVYLKTLLRRVPALDAEIVLFCRKGLALEKLFQGEIPAWARVHYIDDIEKVDSPWRRIRAYDRLFRNAAIDIIHFNGSDHLPAALGARLARIPAIVATYHVLPDGGDMGRYQRGKEMVFSRCLHHAIFNCEISRTQWQQVTRRTSHHGTTIVYNGVEIDDFAPPSADEVLRARHSLDIPEDALVVGMIARLHEMKGHIHLVDAAMEIVKRFPQTRFVLAGEGPAKDAIAARIERNGLEDHFLLVGFREDMRAILAVCNVVAVPSLYKETCSLTALEAMAAGKPLVVSTVGGLPEIVKNGVTGRIVEKADSRELAAALMDVLGDADARADMGQRGKARVSAFFSAELMAGGTFDVYRTAREQAGAVSGVSSTFTRGIRALRRRIRYLRCKIRVLFHRPIHIHIENRWRLGDEVMAIPFYLLMRKRFPTSRITVSVNHPELLKGYEDVLSVDSACGEFDCDMYVFAKDDARSTPRLRHLCERFALSYEPIEPKVQTARVTDLLEKRDGEYLIGCSCGAGWPCKSWLPSHLRELARILLGKDDSVRFVELGRDCPKAGVGSDLVNRTTIEEAAAVLSQCDLYMGPDSGLVHLALALGVPVIGLYGPVRPDVAFGPRKKLHSVLAPIACHGCWSDGRMTQPGVCPLGLDADEFPCMRSISAEVVMETVEAFRLR